jgi:hypothetical protein
MSIPPALRRCVQLLPLVAGLLAPGLARAVDEAELKAAIVFNILLFVDWPGTLLPSGASLTLCVGSQGGLTDAFKRLAGRDVRGHVLELREIAGAPAKPCHAIYVDAADRARLAPVLKPLVAAGALVLSDDAQAPKELTAIVLQRAGNKIVFDVQLQPVRQSQLQLSSKLLRLARAVNE